jgi:hypothetical protein
VTSAELLAALRRQGIEVLSVAGELRTRPAGAVPSDLRPQLLEHRRELLELLEIECPHCGNVDYLPLGQAWRRCWACGTRWGRGRDPGDPPDLERTAGILGARLAGEPIRTDSARVAGWSVGCVLPCPRCGNRAYSTSRLGVPNRRCDSPAGCGYTWNPEASSSRAGS